MSRPERFLEMYLKGEGALLAQPVVQYSFQYEGESQEDEYDKISVLVIPFGHIEHDNTVEMQYLEVDLRYLQKISEGIPSSHITNQKFVKEFIGLVNDLLTKYDIQEGLGFIERYHKVKTYQNRNNYLMMSSLKESDSFHVGMYNVVEYETFISSDYNMIEIDNLEDAYLLSKYPQCKNTEEFEKIYLLNSLIINEGLIIEI